MEERPLPLNVEETPSLPKRKGQYHPPCDSPPDINPGEFSDDPSAPPSLGKEMDPDSEIWPTYATVAAKYDLDLTDDWNKSLDVLLIFVRLFVR